MSKLAEQARSILLAYVRAALVFAVAALGGGIDPNKVGQVWWSVGVGAAWAAIPAALRAVEAALPTSVQSVAARVVLSFVRALVATGLMAFVGPLEGAGAAWRVFVLAAGPALVRALQEALDATAPAVAIERTGKRQVVELPKAA